MGSKTLGKNKGQLPASPGLAAHQSGGAVAKELILPRLLDPGADLKLIGVRALPDGRVLLASSRVSEVAVLNFASKITADAEPSVIERRKQPANPNARPPRRTVPWLLAGIVLILLAIIVAQQLINFATVLPPETGSDTLLLYAL